MTQETLPLEPTQDDLPLTVYVPLTSCANCSKKIARHKAVQTATEDFCSATCAAEYNRY